MALDVPQHEVERGEALLPVDQFPAVVFEPLHHDRLEVVVPATGILDVVEQPPDLVRAPAVAALVVAHEERALDLADQAWFKKRRAPGVHGPIMPHRAEWIERRQTPGPTAAPSPKEEPVLARFELTPTGPLQEQSQRRGARGLGVCVATMVPVGDAEAVDRACAMREQRYSRRPAGLTRRAIASRRSSSEIRPSGAVATDEQEEASEPV